MGGLGVQNTPRAERADIPGDAHFAKVRVHLHFGEMSAERIQRKLFGRRLWVHFSGGFQAVRRMTAD